MPQPGELGFTFDRSGYRVPAIIVSPWVDQGSVYNEEYRHTSLIATLRKTWDLGEAFTRRDASARTFDHVFALRDAPRPEELGHGPSTARARLDARHSVRRGSTQHTGHGHRPRPDRTSQENGHQAAAAA